LFQGLFPYFERQVEGTISSLIEGLFYNGFMGIEKKKKITFSGHSHFLNFS
jgi:hypothetical protein